MKHMNKTLVLSAAAVLSIAAQAADPVIPRGNIAVFKAGTSDTNFPMITARCAPCFVQVFDPVTTNQSSPLVSVAMSTNLDAPGSVWVNHHAGSEGGGLSRTVDRRMLVMEGYTGDIISPTASKPSTDQTVTRGIVTLDAFTNATSFYSDLASWFGVPAGSASGTQDNPTGIASTDGTNFWGTGNFAGTSTELDGTLFYNPNVGSAPFEVQNYLQAAGEARVIGGTLYIAVKSATGVASGIYNFVDPSTGNVVPLPWDPTVPNPYQAPAFTNLFINWGTTFKNILNFDMDAGHTVAYGADQTFGIVKFVNNGGVWSQAPYYFSATNIGTLKQTSGNQGCFAVCVDFSSTNPVIYATTMENGAPTNYVGGFGVNTAQGHQNNNRLIRIVDTGVSPGTNLVAQTLAVAVTTNEFFGGIDFTPDLYPLITSNPSNYATTNGGSASFSLTADCAFPVTYQWLQNSNTLADATDSTLTLNNLTTDTNGFAYQCVVSDQYGSVTSAPAILTVTASPVAPMITSGTNNVTGYVGGYVTFRAVSATGTQPFAYQWYQGVQQLMDDGVKYYGSTSPSLTVSNLATADAGSYYMVVMNAAGYASNKVDVLTVKYRTATINAGQPQSVTTFVGFPTSLTANQTGATPPVTNQWYRGSTLLTDGTEFSGTATATLNIAATTTSDSATNYYIVVSNPGGSVTSAVATVTVLVPPAHSYVSYSNQVYTQTFDGLPDPGGVSVNSINNPLDPGTINGIAYSLANPFDFAYPVIINSYIGGLGLNAGRTNMLGWYGVADTNAVGVDGISRFGAQDGDQSTGGVISFGPNDVNGGVVGTNRALGLLSTSTTGSTAFGLKLINSSTNTLNYINLSFVGEFWRNNKAARTMSFSYAIDPMTNSFVLAPQPQATNASPTDPPNTTPQEIPGTVSVPGLAFSWPTNDGSVLAMDGTQSSNQVSIATNNMALSTPWSPGTALWLIWSINYYGQGTGQGYAIDNLIFSAPTAPTVATAPASSISASNATLNASVNPNADATSYYFQYGTTAGYASFTPTNNLVAGSSTIAVSNVLTGLLPGTTYHYQIVAVNAIGAASGADAAFTTATQPEIAGAVYSKTTGTQLSFNNSSNASFTVWGTTNLIPANWLILGHPTESPAGHYIFVHGAATNKLQQFYRVSTP
jgi:hypothetical protein